MFQSISIHVFVEQMAGLFNIFSHMGFVCHLEDVFVVYREIGRQIPYDFLVCDASLHPVRCEKASASFAPAHTCEAQTSMPKPPSVTPVYAHVHNAVLQYELARKAFVTTLNDLLAAGDPGQTDALLRAGVVNLLHAPLVQGACPKPAPISNSSPGRSPA